MDSNNENHILFFLSRMEKEYPVNKWESEGISFWPLLKNIIFFRYHQSANNVQPLSRGKRYLNKLKKLINKNALSAFILLRFTRFENAEYVFSGARSYRTLHHDQLFNRYFDPVMDELEEKYSKKSILFEYTDVKINACYKSDRIMNLTRFIPYYKARYRKKDIRLDAEKLSEALGEIHSKFGLSPASLRNQLIRDLRSTHAWKNLWQDILKKVRPRYAFGLCYYNPPMYGMNLAAQELGVISIDMQHGGQGILHPAYNFASLPDNGYNLLPKVFWCWDKSSSDQLKSWIKGSSAHTPLSGGNPWIQFSSESTALISDEKKIILFTLQTTLNPILPPSVIDCIRTTPDDYQWWLRLHPRMTREETQNMYSLLESGQVLEKVEIEKVSSLPLPVILKNTFAHVTQHSGCVVEAAIMGVKINIILHELGKITFQSLIERKEAAYYNPRDSGDLFSFIRNLEQSGEYSSKEHSSPDFRHTLKIHFVDQK